MGPTPDEALGETAADSAASDETLRAVTKPDVIVKTPSKYDVGQRSTAGQDKMELGVDFMVKIKT